MEPAEDHGVDHQSGDCEGVLGYVLRGEGWRTSGGACPRAHHPEGHEPWRLWRRGFYCPRMAFPDGQVRAGLGGEAVPQGRTPPLRADRNGVFGPFEDLITLLVVIVAIVILIASIALALSNVRDDANRARFLNGTHNFVSSLRSYGNLTHEGAEGVFDGAKVTSLN